MNGESSRKFTPFIAVCLAIIINLFTGIFSTLNSGVSKASAPFSYNHSINAQVLYDNGPLVNSAGTGVGGADESVLQNLSLGMESLGFGHQATAGNRIADDFTVPDAEGWNVESITFFAYQTDSTTTSPITAVNMRIWDGPPDDPGSSVLFGDTSTNRLVNTTWSNIYRVAEDTSGSNIQRLIMANTVGVGLFLPQGTYWLDWQSDGSASLSGPWAPPITINGETTTGNALFFDGSGSTWLPVLDGGTNTQQGFPFVIFGNFGEGTPQDTPTPTQTQTTTQTSTSTGTLTATPTSTSTSTPTGATTTATSTPTSAPTPVGNVVQDGGFEQGTPNPYWTEASTNFGSPLCDVNCGGPSPHSGNWYAWFGGVESDEIAAVEQDVVIENGTAILSFWLLMGRPANGGTGSLVVSLDSTVVFTATEADEPAYSGGYTEIVLDVSEFADDGTHTLWFESNTTGGTLNFFVDDVAIMKSGPFPTSANTATSSPTSTNTPSPTAEPGDVYLPLVSKNVQIYFIGPNEAEPNNNYLEANGPLLPGKEYFGFPNDSNDYFSILLESSGTIKVELSNHTGSGVQLQLYYQVVSSESLVKFDAAFPYSIQHTGLPGWYYIRVFTESGFNENALYIFKVTYPD